MKKVSILMTMLAIGCAAWGAQSQKYLDYIAQWSNVAIEHQRSYGIPASITLAQGLLESAAGSSELAVKANNHFGIKCTSDWMGGVYRYDDDRRNECFREYRNAEESFKDHALFLKRTRYERLFSIPVTNYKDWAYGLKECGYATDPAYPQKLIKVIEEYDLANIGKGVKPRKDGGEPVYGGTHATKQTPVDSQVAANGTVVLTEAAGMGIVAQAHQSPYTAPLSAQDEKKMFYTQHGKHKNNGVSYVQANEGDTYASIAFSLNITERALREQNDALGRTLTAGDKVYLQKKKSQAPKDKAYVWVRPGETVWSICQREGITEKSFRAMNGLRDDVLVFQTRQQVLLRKEKKQ